MRKSSCWEITYNQFDPAQEGAREALCTLGNGYFATRGAIPEAFLSDVHYQGTYIAGVYNRLITNIAGKKIANEDLVNCPSWLFLTFKIDGDEWFYPSSRGILYYRQRLDIRKGVLSRSIRFQNRKGQRTLIETENIVHMGNSHYGAIRYMITPENYSGWITVKTVLDGSVINSGVERYRPLNSKHWKPSSLGSFRKNGVFLSMKTIQSRIEVAEAARIRIFVGQKEIKPAIKTSTKRREIITQEFRICVNKKKSYKIEKIVSIFTSQDKDIQTPVKAAIKAVQEAGRFSALLLSHQQAWAKLWKKFDIQIKGDDFSQKVIRLHIFHLLQIASRHNINIDAGFPARGLHGEAYRGHVFWDEIFALPLYALHIPEIAKALLLYRYRRLPQAREYARKAGFRGSMFPWQSASSGKEETQVIHLNPISGIWGPDYSSFQRHVSFAIAYNVWRYWKVAGDFDFLLNYGAEILLSIAQFGASLVRYNSRDKRYHTQGLVGPDEFHEAFPGSPKPGLTDNAYTNFMIVWTLLKAQEVLSILPEDDKTEIVKRLHLGQKELSKWEEITHKMNIAINRQGIISQFDGYFRLKELDWAGYKARYKEIHRMDRILKAEGNPPDDYKVSKQADVLMFFYLFPTPEIKNIFQNLGYSFDKNTLEKNYEYYLKRTSHGSTLSKVVHCFVAQLLGRQRESWQWFREVLESDVYDTQGGTTPEGIHAGVMGGSIDIVMRSFAGISLLGDIIKINPSLPKIWQRIKLRFHYKQSWISLSITRYEITILVQGAKKKAVKMPVEINKKLYCLYSGRKFKVSLRKS